MIERAIVVAAAALAVGVAFATSDTGRSSSGGSDEPIVLGFPYSDDTEDLLQPLIDEFNAEEHTQAGRRIVVEGEALTSGVAESGISEQTMKPVIWGPASSLWGRLLNHDVGEAWVDDKNESIVVSPQVIAMWEPLARALGYPDEPIGWNDVLALATDPDGWGAKGQPHYGKFKLGHTNPNSSTSGLSAVAAMYYALAGGLTAEDIERPGVRRRVREIERAIVHYGYKSDDFLDQMERYGPDYAHAVAVQETSLIKHNEETKGQKLVAVYPAEGTFVADYPFIILRAPWVDEDERAAAERFQRWLLPRITVQRAAAESYRAPGAAPIEPVDAAHGADPTQPDRRIELPAPDVIARIQEDWNEDRKPANVMLVVDTSGSMGRNGLLEPVQAALGGFLDELKPNDRVGLTTFGGDVFQPVPVARFGENEEELRQTIQDLIPGGKSVVYDGVRSGFGEISDLEDESRINAVVVLAESPDAGSSVALESLTQELSAACELEGVAIPVITVAYGDDSDTEALERIAGACQGRALTATPDDVGEVLERIGLLF